MKLSCADTLIKGDNYIEKALKLKEWGFEGISISSNGTLWKDDQRNGEVLDMQKETGIFLAEFTLTGMDFGHLHEDEGEGVEKSVKLGCRSVDLTYYANSGITTLSYGGRTPEEEEVKRFAKHMGRICNHAKIKNREVLLEACNRYETPFCTTLDRAIEILKQIPHENVGLTCNLFHMAMEEENVAQALKRAGRYVKFVHVADSNGRIPGKGFLNWKEIFESLEEIGYDGYLSLNASGASEEDVKKAATFIKDFIK